jgi:hypothetical protein
MLWFTPVVLRSFWPSMIATYVAATKRSYDQLPPLPSGNLTYIAIEHCHLCLIYLLKLLIFHSYVSLAEGKPI